MNKKRVLGWFLFILGIALTLIVILTGFIFGRIYIIFAAIITLAICAWGWDWAHPKSKT